MRTENNPIPTICIHPLSTKIHWTNKISKCTKRCGRQGHTFIHPWSTLQQQKFPEPKKETVTTDWQKNTVLNNCQNGGTSFSDNCGLAPNENQRADKVRSTSTKLKPGNLQHFVFCQLKRLTLPWKVCKRSQLINSADKTAHWPHTWSLSVFSNQLTR